VVQCKSGGKDIKRDYAKEKLKENMGQSEFLLNCSNLFILFTEFS
jgi:hypothetical protein